MNRQLRRPLVFLLAVLLLLAASAAWAAGGGAPTTSPPLVVDGVGLDFERVVQAPEGLQHAAVRALATDSSGALRHAHYTATVLEASGDWAHLVLIPTAVLDSNWELPLAAEDAIDIIATLDENGAWQGVVKSAVTLAWLRSAVPDEFMNLEPSLPEETFLFPWTAGQTWRVSQGWHSGAIDFFPIAYSNPAVNGAVLAMGGGTLSQVCNDGEQAHLRINHGNVTSGYLHLDAHTVRAHDLNQLIPRGRLLGLLYDGDAFFEPNAYCSGYSGWQFSTPCGCGTGPHLHFSSSNTGITVDGHNLGAVGVSVRSSFTSSNVRDDGPPPPAPDAVTIVNTPALTPAFTPQCGSGWKQIDGFDGANGYVTLNTNQVAQSTNRADWMPTLPQSGRYRVSAYIPNHAPIFWGCGSVQSTIDGDTSEARYQITHAHGVETVAANQRPVADNWLPLGNFYFERGAGARVRLTDLNGEENLSRTISFSAMRFVLQPPDGISGLSASDGAYIDRVQLTWEPATGAATYDVYRKLPGAATFTRIGATATSSYADSSAIPGVTYQYTIRAVNIAGAGPSSAAVLGARQTAHLSFLPVLGR